MRAPPVGRRERRFPVSPPNWDAENPGGAKTRAARASPSRFRTVAKRAWITKDFPAPSTHDVGIRIGLVRLAFIRPVPDGLQH